MKQGCLIVAALLIVAGFVYLNDAQNQMMRPRPSPSPPPTTTAAAATRSDSDLQELARRLQATQSVMVAVTPESFAAFNQAARENPDKPVFALGVTLEDRLYPVPTSPGAGAAGARVAALVVYTDDAHLPPDVPFRTDTLGGVLDYVAGHAQIHHVVLNPPADADADESDAIVLGPDEIETLRQSWR